MDLLNEKNLCSRSMEGAYDFLLYVDSWEKCDKLIFYGKKTYVFTLYDSDLPC